MRHARHQPSAVPRVLAVDAGAGRGRAADEALGQDARVGPVGQPRRRQGDARQAGRPVPLPGDKPTATIFDVGGNKYRIAALVDYDKRVVFIKRVMTHAEYDTKAWHDDFYDEA